MPVLTTLAIVALLGGDDDSACPFFESGLLREQIERGLRIDEAEREPSLAIADRLSDLLERYALSVDSTLDAYVASSSNPTARATDLIDRLQPMDHERQETMREIIGIRQQLVDLLNDEQWQRVFAG